MGVVSLACYDLPEIRPAAEAWWAAIRTALEGLGLDSPPRQLLWPDDLEEHWAEDPIFLTQTCGYPLVTFLKDKLRPLVTPCYEAEGCAGPLYSSALVVSASHPASTLEALRGCRVAINSPRSHSGYNVLRAMVAPLAGGKSFFGEIIRTGGHLRSCAAVAEGRADLAAIDCVTLALAERHRPEAVEGLRVLTYSPQAPALPYVTALSTDDRTCLLMREALYDVAADPDLSDLRDTLLLRGFAALPEEAYGEMTRLAEEARTLGYEELK